METASVRSDSRTSTSGATVMGVIALVATSVGFAFSAMFAFGASGFFILFDVPWVYEWSDWYYWALVVGMQGVPLTVFGTVLGIVNLFMARRQGERARAARLAVVVGLLSMALAVAVIGYTYLTFYA